MVVQVVNAPLITGAGCGAIMILVLTEESQADVFVSVSEILPLPFDGQVTVMLFKFVAVTIPPVTFQL